MSSFRDWRTGTGAWVTIDADQSTNRAQSDSLAYRDWGQ